MAADPVTIIVDDWDMTDKQDQVGKPGGWSSSAEYPGIFNNTVTFPEFPENGSFIYKFEGVSVALFGITPPSAFRHGFNRSVPVFDSSNIQELETYTPYKYPAMAQGGQFYTSQTLPSKSQIDIGILGAHGLALDYALVTVDESTDLSQKTILVDDSNLEITWDDSWEEQQNRAISVNCSLPEQPHVFHGSPPDFQFTANMYPHGNGSHISNTTGSSFTFQFAGTSIAIFGFSPGLVDGVLGMNFTLDSETTTKVFTQDSMGGSSGNTLTHFKYFDASLLEAGNHTITGVITKASGESAANIDYITYTPSFISIRDKPVFQSASGSDIPDPNTNGSTPHNSGGDTPPHRSSVVSIVGGVVGGCIGIALIVGVLWLIGKRRKNQKVAQGKLQ
ncbi:hypothetical protein VKT23_008088 [Stygiomarasmius scandens]|uniref:Uncharacterized protein n=1 Tax=Marasmiellus scandens TaxID=2682957 RepID=A0ABR1JMK6_9AGAR